MAVAAIFVMWQKIFCINFNLFILRSPHMKFEFNFANGLWENFVLIYWWDHNIKDLGWKGKGQPWPLKLIYSHCVTLALTVLKKSSFQKKSHLNALGSKFDLDVKKVKVNLESLFEQIW